MQTLRLVLALVGYNQPGFAELRAKTKSAALSLAEMRFGKKNMII